MVDDQQANLDALEAAFKPPDYRLVHARSAQEALLKLLDGEFAAIVLDINMPLVNGIELAQIIKQRARTRDIPILFLTAYLVDEQDILLGYGAGAVDYLSKPVHPEHPALQDRRLRRSLSQDAGAGRGQCGAVQRGRRARSRRRRR